MRIIYPEEVVGVTMFIVAVMGLIFNLIQMKILHSGDGHYHLGGGHNDHGHDHGHSSRVNSPEKVKTAPAEH
jgi:Co/Zn/Cd efflux system component